METNTDDLGNERFETTNVSTLWDKNIFENIENLEKMERLAREGCQSIIEYIDYPINSIHLILPNIQYKNLKMMVSEIGLLLSDLSPIITEEFYDEIMEENNKYKIVMLNRNLFIKESYNKLHKNPKLVECRLRPAFYETLENVSKLKVKIIKKIAPILFVEKKGEEESSKLK